MLKQSLDAISVTSKDLKSNLGSSRTCTTMKAEDFEVEAKSRGDDSKALAGARRVINDATGGAEQIAYGLKQVLLPALACYFKR